MRSHIRIELPSLKARDGRVFAVGADGSEVEISSCVTGFTIRGEVTGLTYGALDLRGIVTVEPKP